MEQILKFDFETLDTIFIGNSFLISISDGLQEELRLVVAAETVVLAVYCRVS